MGSQGDGPKIDWATPRVPIGWSAIDLYGQRFDPDSLSVDLPGTGITTQITANSNGKLSIDLKWPMPAPLAGDVTVVVKNSKGTADPKVITLVQPDFPSLGTIDLSPMKPTWLYMGMGSMGPAVFLFDQQAGKEAAYYSYYSDSAGTVDKTPTRVTGAVLAAPGDVDGDGSTDVAAINATPELTLCQTNGMCAGATQFLIGKATTTKTFDALGVGAADGNKSLIAAASTSKELIGCFWVPGQGPQACAKVASLASNAQTVIVQPLSPVESRRADILVLSKQPEGKLALYRNDSGSTFKLQSELLNADVAGRSLDAVAMADMDGKNGPDLVAANKDGVYVLRNDGQGNLTASTLMLKQIPTPSAITLGDIDHDGRPDLIMSEAATGNIKLWLNQGSDPAGDIQLLGPVEAMDVNATKPVSAGPKGSVTLDRKDGAQVKRRIITMTSTGELRSWDNTLKP